MFSPDSKGFSLLEMAMVLVISGLIMAAGLAVYKAYLDSRNFHDTYSKEVMINDAIMTFYGMAKRYPCPADGSLPETDPGYGVENCNNGPSPPPPVAMGSCNVSGGFCNAAGRATTVDGTPGPDSVLTGVVPFKTIMTVTGAGGLSNALSVSSTVDAWGRFFSYAVTKTMTSNSTFSAAAGAISVIKEDGASLLAQPGIGHYVIVSHGKNGAGGFAAATGSMPTPCSAGSVSEQENCDNDATFMNGLLSLAAAPSYYDDIVFSQSWVVSSLWDVSANGIDIFNKNPGNVGIGTTPPVQKLDISGSMSIQGSSGKTRSGQICDPAGGYCFPADALGGPVGIDCKNMTTASGTYRLMTGIANVAPLCSASMPLPTVAAQPACPLDAGGAKQFVSGINVDGAFICSSF